MNHDIPNHLEEILSISSNYSEYAWRFGVFLISHLESATVSDFFHPTELQLTRSKIPPDSSHPPLQRRPPHQLRFRKPLITIRFRASTRSSFGHPTTPFPGRVPRPCPLVTRRTSANLCASELLLGMSLNDIPVGTRSEASSHQQQ